MAKTGNGCGRQRAKGKLTNKSFSERRIRADKRTPTRGVLLTFSQWDLLCPSSYCVYCSPPPQKEVCVLQLSGGNSGVEGKAAILLTQQFQEGGVPHPFWWRPYCSHSETVDTQGAMSLWGFVLTPNGRVSVYSPYFKKRAKGDGSCRAMTCAHHIFVCSPVISLTHLQLGCGYVVRHSQQTLSKTNVCYFYDHTIKTEENASILSSTALAVPSASNLYDVDKKKREIP